MKLKLTLPLAVFLLLLTVALCTGRSAFFLLSLLILLVIAGLVIACSGPPRRWRVGLRPVGRKPSTAGDADCLSLRMRHRGLIPIAPLLLELSDPSGNRDREIRLKNMPGRLQSFRLPVHTAHIGVFSVGLHACTVEDLLGLVRSDVPLEHTLS